MFINTWFTNAIILQIQKLQDLGYSAFSFGFFQEDVHFVGTSDANVCSHHKIIQFLIALITACEYFSQSDVIFTSNFQILIGNPPQITDVMHELMDGINTGQEIDKHIPERELPSKPCKTRGKMPSTSQPSKKGKVPYRTNSANKGSIEDNRDNGKKKEQQSILSLLTACMLT